MSPMPVEPPNPIAIARELSALTSTFGTPTNYERACLEKVHSYLSMDPPDLIPAKLELEDAMAHSFRPHWKEHRPEVWLVAACARVLDA